MKMKSQKTIFVVFFCLKLSLSALIAPKSGDFIKCRYTVKVIDQLLCDLEISNPNGREDIGKIEGALPEFTTFDSVTELQILNQHTTIIPPVVCEQFPNLSKLTVSVSRVSDLNPRHLKKCSALKILEISGNALKILPDRVFESLSRLEILRLSKNKIQKISSDTFAQLHNLNSLVLSDNELTVLPQSTFEPLVRLEDLMMDNNRVEKLESRSFGHSLRSLRTFSAAGNQIDAIEWLWLENALSLRSINVVDNRCISSNMWTISSHEEVIQKLEQCIKNFVDGRFIKCENAGNQCDLKVNDPNGRDDFNNIDASTPSQTTSVTIKNQSTRTLPSIICHHLVNLQKITAKNSQIKILTSKAFENCKNLRHLEIEDNDMQFLTSGTFHKLLNLVELHLPSNNIESLDPATFQGLSSLSILNLARNSLVELPSDCFDSLTSIKTINIESNHIETIELSSFGRSLSSLEDFNGIDNKIYGIEASWVENSKNLKTLSLKGNQCTSQNFETVVRENLADCLANFQPRQPEATISCEYANLQNSLDYECRLEIKNLDGFESFRSIKGQHMRQRRNSEVVEVSAWSQNTKNIPAVLCRQFLNLKVMTIASSRVVDINARSLDKCGSLEDLRVNSNLIHSIGEYVLPQSLRSINFEDNKLSLISPKAFNGLELVGVSFEKNNLKEIQGQWFESCRQTLRSLNFKGNGIKAVGLGALAGLRALQVLSLSQNELTRVDYGSFEGSLDKVTHFDLSNNKISAIDSKIFDNAGNLVQLNLLRNNCAREMFEIGRRRNRDETKKRLANCFKNFSF